MKYRRLGRTNIEVSEIGFGTWTLGTGWWGEVDEVASLKLLRQAIDLGVNFFDTADTYGNGLSERLLSKALTGHRHRAIIATKFGYDFYSSPRREGHAERPQNFSRDFIRFALERSLERLRTEYVDLYQLHNPKMEALIQDEVFETLEELREEGKIRYYGVALGPDIGWFDEGAYAIRQRKPTSVQIVYNILEQEPGRRFFPIARESGASMLVRVPHASGLLDGQFKPDTVFSDSDHRSHRKREWLMRGLKKVEKLAFLTNEKKRTLGQMALKFILSEVSVASVLLTVTSLEALQEFVQSSEQEALTTAELARIEELYQQNFHVEREESYRADSGRNPPINA